MEHSVQHRSLEAATTAAGDFSGLDGLARSRHRLASALAGDFSGLDGLARSCYRLGSTLTLTGTPRTGCLTLSPIFDASLHAEGGGL